MRKCSVPKILLSVLLSLIAVLLLFVDTPAREKSEARVSPLSDNSEKILIADANGSDFKLIFSSDQEPGDQALASEFEALVREVFGFRIRPKTDTAETVSEKEILLGNTNRAESAELLKRINIYIKNPDDLTWCFGVIGGKLLYTATDSAAFSYGKTEFLSYLAENDFTVSADLFVVNSITRAEYESILEQEERAEHQKKVDALVERNSAFTLSQFGGAPKEMGDSPFESPHFYPTYGTHPRFLITEGDIDQLREFINAPENKTLKNAIFTMADKKDCIEGFDIKYKNGVLFRYSEITLAEIEAKALAYLITDDEIYGYEAIIAAKNAMLTLVYPDVLHIDTYHGASHTMTTVALAYDWCYNLLSEEDKAQIIGGVSNLMCPQLEFNLFLNPKPEIGSVSGHGTGPQFLRDYMSVAIAFADEAPDWWEYIGGKFYEDFVPVIDICYKGSWGSQGTGGYGTSKYYLYTWAAYAVKTATGELPYENAEGAGKTAHFWLSQLTPNSTYFQTGDLTASRDGGTAEWFYLFPAAALYSDPEMAYFARKFTNGYSEYFYNFSHAITPALMAVFASQFPEFSEDIGEKFNTVQYFSSPAGQMTARSDWSENAAVALMKIGEITMGNHDNYDHGTFQIYYKGLLAATSGSYDKYGSDSHRYYRQATVAHNGILVFDPSLSDSEPIMSGSRIANASRYYYSGSQRRREEASTIEEWLSGEYDLGKIIGADFDYSSCSGNAKYAYIAGDITKAYPEATVDYVGRRMLTVFTDDKDFPMLFFTFDTVKAKGEGFRKSFLLHTIDEPEINKENMTATVTAGDGKLIVHSISGADKLVKIGGSGYAYWISNSDYENQDGTPSGKNCIDAYTTSDRAETIWGRIELSTAAGKHTDMLTAMYVTDKNNEKTLPVSKISTEKAEGAKLGDVFAIFAKNTKQEYKAFEFNTEGSGLFNYYISGLEAGTWHISVDGVRVANVATGVESGIISFIAPTGNVSVYPGSDVIGDNGGRIVYETGGAVLPDDAPMVYKNDTAVPLPKDLSRGTDIFAGWYTAPTYDETSRIETTPLGVNGTVTLYAKWITDLFIEDYSKTTLSAVDQQITAGGASYNTKGKTGASFITDSDESGKFLYWTVGTLDPHFHYINYVKNLASINDDCVTYTVSFSPDGDKPLPNSDFRIISKKDINGADISSKRLGIFRIAEGSGDVYIGDTNTKIATAEAGKITTLTFVIDFKNGNILYYGKDNNLSAFISFGVPTGVGTESTAEWKRCFDSYIFYWYANSTFDNAAMKIYSIKVQEGNRAEQSAAESNKISYVLNGSKLSEDAPKSYFEDAPTPLPIPVKENSEFYGWYTDEKFTEDSRVTEVPAGTQGVYTVYAKWGVVYIDAKYNEGSLDVENKNKWLDGITYKSSGNTGASFKTKLDEHGNAYVKWTKGETDPFIYAQNSDINFSTSSDTVFSYTINLKALAGKNPISTDFRIISKENTIGAAASARLGIFTTDTDGKVKLGDSKEAFTTLSETKITTLRIAVDFGEGMLKAYSDDGNIIAEHEIIPPSNTGAATAEEWQKLFNSYLIYWYGGGGNNDSALAVYSITLSEGNIFE